MKKIIGILTIIVTMFFGIDVVNAEAYLFAPATMGTCTLKSSSANMCEYSCSVEGETYNIWGDTYANFDYIITLESGKLKHDTANFVGDGNHFPTKGNYSRKFKEKIEANSLYNFITSGGFIYEYTEEEIFKMIDNINFQDFSVKDIYHPYYYIGESFTDNVPVDFYFIENGSLVCRDVKVRLEPDTNAGAEESTELIEALLNWLTSDGVFRPIWEEIFGNKFEIELTNYSRFVKNKISILRNEEVDIFGDDDFENNACGLLGGENSQTVSLIKDIYGYIKIIIPLLIVVLSIADFIKVVGTGKDDDMKKTIKKFATRIIIAVVFVLVPILISLIINVSGISSQYPSLGEGTKAIFCILG